jgi:hypothetical protein
MYVAVYVVPNVDYAWYGGHFSGTLVAESHKSHKSQARSERVGDRGSQKGE